MAPLIQGLLDNVTFSIVATGLLTAASAALLGTFLVVRGQAMLSDAGSALSGLSRYAGLVMAPKVEHPFKQIEFLPLSPGRALVVVVADNGMLENRVIEVPVGVGASSLIEAGNYLTARLTGRSFGEARAIIEADMAAQRSELDSLTQKVVQTGLATWGADQNDDDGVLIVRGHAHLLADVTTVADHGLASPPAGRPSSSPGAIAGRG